MQKLPFLKNKSKFAQKGQALLLLLLSLAVILTVVLSVASRSVTEVGVSTLEEDALRAFSAAEAGIEEALLTSTGTGPIAIPVDPANPNVTYTSTITTPATGNYFNYPDPVNSGESATFWFVSHDTNNNLTCIPGIVCLRAERIRRLCWGNPETPNNQPTTPAVELTIFYDDDQEGTNSDAFDGGFDSVSVVRGAYDPYLERTGDNNFVYVTGGSCTLGDRTYPFSIENLRFNVELPVSCAEIDPGCLLMAKVRVLYSDVAQNVGMHVQATGGTELPAQGFQLSSTGYSGESTRRVNVFQSYPNIPSVFDSVVFSGGGLVK